MLEDLHFVLHLLFSHTENIETKPRTAVRRAQWIFPTTTGVLNINSCISFHAIVLSLVITTLLSIAQNHSLIFLLFTVQLEPHIRIMAVIVNTNNTKAHNASLPFTIKAIIVIAPTCNLN